MPFDQLVSRRCLLESKKTLQWEKKSCDFAYRNLNLLDGSYMKVLTQSCSGKDYKACGIIDRNTKQKIDALPKLL